MLIKSILTVLITASLVTTQTIRQGVISIQGNVNQSTNILIPFTHLVSATVSEVEYREILNFAPNRFRLHQIKNSQDLPKSNKTLLQQLTTPFTNEYIHIFRLSNFYFVFKMPNHFIVLKENHQSFSIQRQFTIPEIKKKDIKFEVVNQEILLIYLPSNKLIVVKFDSYKVADNIFNTTNVIFSKAINKDNTQQFAFFNNQMYSVSFLNGQPTLKQPISQPTQFAELRVILVEQIAKSKALWMLDANLGLIWAKKDSKNQLKDSFILLQQRGCYQLDVKVQKEINVLLTCASKGQTFFIKAIYFYEKQKPILVKQWSPHIQSCKTKQFIFYKQHIFSLQKQSLDIFFPSIYKGQKDLFYTKNWISLTGHSTYLLLQEKDELFLYSVSNHQFSKSRLILQDYTLQIKSSKQLSTKFNLTLEYICPNSPSAVKQICIYQQVLQVNIHNKYLSFTQVRSINIGIMLLFGTCILAISYICHMKYKSIEDKAAADLKALNNPTNYKL